MKTIRRMFLVLLAPLIACGWALARFIDWVFGHDDPMPWSFMTDTIRDAWGQP